MTTKSKQLKLLKNEPMAYGGDLLKTRSGRSRARPLATKNSMHLVLRSTKATGDWSFRRSQNRKKIEQILNRFAGKYGIRLLSVANVGNHLHLHIQLLNRNTYRPFIRAVTGAIAMAISGRSRWAKKHHAKLKFWDRRPFSRVVVGWRALLSLRDYIRINRLEGYGYHRSEAMFIGRRTRLSTA